VKARGFVTCAECDDFPCEKYEGFFDWDSFITRKVCGPNIKRIKKVGLKIWLQEQTNRRAILENLLFYYNEGRSRNFYCIAVALMPAGLIKEAVNKAKKLMAKNKIADSDIKTKAKILRTTIKNFASRSKIDLKLRKKLK
jgi:nucleoside diphosphate kinase